MFRVVIADDEQKVSLLIKTLIKWDELGLELVGIANDGLAAFEMIHREKPDIVITDIRMPGYDGIELISKVKGLYPDVCFVIISGYRHFDYAQKAIRFGVEDYLLKPLKEAEINETLRKMTERFKQDKERLLSEAQQKERINADRGKLGEQFLLKLLLEDKTQSSLGFASIEEINREYALAFIPELFQGFMIKPDLYYEAVNEHIAKLLQEKTLTIAVKHIKGVCEECVLLPMEKGIYVMANFREDQKKALRKSIVAVIDELQSLSELFDKIKVTVGAGGIVHGPGGFKDTLMAAEQGVANRLLQGTGRIIEKAKPEKCAQSAGLFNQEMRKRVLKSVEILSENEMHAVIADLQDTLARLQGIEGTDLVELVDEVIQTAFFAMKQQNLLSEDVSNSKDLFYKKLNMCNKQKDLFLLMEGFLTSILRQTLERQKSENNKPIREVQKYIGEHYGTSITLESVSQMAGFNPTYFSMLFKKETGINFLEYLTEVRIKEAKRLLADKAKTIADVANEVGYSDVKHFSKIFTKIAGIHPSKYRKLYY